MRSALARTVACLLALWMLGAAATALAAPSPEGSPVGGRKGDARICETLSARHARIEFHHERFDLTKSEDLRRLAAAIESDLQAGAATEASREAAGDMPVARNSPPRLSESDRQALTAMKALAARALASDPDGSLVRSVTGGPPAAGEGPRCEALLELAEIGDSLDLGTRFPVRRRLDIVQVPFYYLDLMHNPIARGTERAWNLAPDGGSIPDASLVDPAPSTFWSRPKDIASRDLYHAFGPILRLGDEPCVYDEPKLSYGTTPGFTMKCGDRTIKVKFGEKENSKRDSEVAVTRLYDALGFHTEPNDYASEIRVRYDRRILLEFNSRKALDLTITAFGFVPIFRIKVQTVEDPFRFIRSVVMADGQILTPDALAEKVIRPDILQRSVRRAKKHPRGTLADHYREDAAAFERRIDHLVMQEANIQARGSGGQNIGPWAWDRLDHDKRRELRGAGLLAAWTNYFDVRWDNNRLKFIDRHGAGDAAGEKKHANGAAIEGNNANGVADPGKNADGDKGGPHVTHVLSDLGNSLGRAENFKVDAQGLVNDFPWTFTEPAVHDGKGRETKRFRIVRYQPIFDNEAFREMTVDDARWMARLIAQLTENQIAQTLIAAGYTSAEVRLYVEKLVSRRDAMVRDLGLASEIAPLRPDGIDRAFDYDPKKDGPVVATAGDGSNLRPIESRDLVVRAGRVEPR